MPFDLDAPPDRRASDSRKWRAYPPDVLPLWVADMDFAVAPAITAAIARRLDHPVFGYALPDAAVRDILVAQMRIRYGWTIACDDIVFLPGVEGGFNMALQAVARPGDAVMQFVPVYKPLLDAPGHWGLRTLASALRPEADLDEACRLIAGAKALLLCNPNNPVGKVFTRAELDTLAKAALRAEAAIISDEIHCDVLFDGRIHTPIAALGREVAARTVTLMSASKAYNIAGLKTAFAIIPDRDLRKRFESARRGMVDSVNAIGLAATQAAYSAAEPWRQTMLAYLQANRDWLATAMAARLPAIKMVTPEATCLAWLDCRALAPAEEPYDFFLRHAKVALSRGGDFGAAWTGFVRLNFGCSRATLESAVGRMAQALT